MIPRLATLSVTAAPRCSLARTETSDFSCCRLRRRALTQEATRRQIGAIFRRPLQEARHRVKPDAADALHNNSSCCTHGSALNSVRVLRCGLLRVLR